MDTEHEIQSHIENGMMAAGFCTSTDDYVKKTKLYEMAHKELDPYCTVQYQMPHVALAMGVLSHHLAAATVHFYEEQKKNLGDLAAQSPYAEQLESGLVFSAQMMENAGNYFSLAADMEDTKQDLSPAQAKNYLAQLYEQGLLGEGQKDLQRAFQLRFEAAEAGWPEAQINLAIMYFNGEGVEKNPLETRKWLDQAFANRDKLSRTVQEDLAIMREEIDSFLRDEKKHNLTAQPHSRSFKPH